MSRLFVAVWPPDDVVSELTAVRRKDQRGVRFVPPQDWHITLRFLGEARPDEVRDVLDRTSLPPTRASLGPGVDLLTDRVLGVPVHGVDDLAAAVTSATADIGEAPRRRFTGHLTLARLKRHATVPAALGAFVSASFVVEEIALVQSRLHPQGARYETLHTWPVTRRG